MFRIGYSKPCAGLAFALLMLYRLKSMDLLIADFGAGGVD
jgi:hypothetical protein